MKSIKAYLLPLFFLLFFCTTLFSQTTVEKEVKEVLKMELAVSKTDSILIYGYFTEEDYNKLHKIETADLEEYYGDEVYNETPRHKHKSKNVFWDTVVTELVVEIVINTIFIISTFW